MIRNLLKKQISSAFPDVQFDILTPPNPEMGDYSTNLPFVLAKRDKKNPVNVGQEIVAKFLSEKELLKYFNKIEFAPPGFINFYLSEDFLREGLAGISGDKDYGHNNTLEGKKVMIEFTDPNPFKLFHVGHLMSNTIGEAIARLYEASGARVIRVNYQGDVGLHVAKTVWAISRGKWPKDLDMEGYLPDVIFNLGAAYTQGSVAYSSGDEDVIKEIELVNKEIYDRSNEEINEIYDVGKRRSLEYFDEIYKKLGTKFDKLFFESETARDGLKIINEHKNIFVESDGALIFKGEEYGLHSRVFINSRGLPTYEAKELGLNKKKFELYSPDLSIVVTGNEINDYFKVLLKVMDLTMPEVAKKTRHIGHGMMRFANGKMSSRTGNVITAESIIDELVEKVSSGGEDRLTVGKDKDHEAIAIGAIKYSILKQSIGQDIIFDPDRVLAIKGDSALYIQYAYVRLNSVFEKSNILNSKSNENVLDLLKQQEEVLLMRKLIKLPEIIEECMKDHQINRLALYTYELASCFHNFYEKHQIIQDDKELEGARLVLCRVVATVIKESLRLMGISAPKRMDNPKG